MTAEEIALALFGLLDDIDTMDDAARDNDRMFRDEVRKIQRKRFDYATTDGYSVTLKTTK